MTHKTPAPLLALYKSGLRTPVQCRFSPAMSAVLTVSHSNKLYFLFYSLSHVWKFFQPAREHNTLHAFHKKQPSQLWRWPTMPCSNCILSELMKVLYPNHRQSQFNNLENIIQTAFQNKTLAKISLQLIPERIPLYTGKSSAIGLESPWEPGFCLFLHAVSRSSNNTWSILNIIHTQRERERRREERINT